MYKHLTYAELCTIYYTNVNKFTDNVSWSKCLSALDLAKQLGKHKSTIYRAINYIKETNWSPEINCSIVKYRTRIHKKSRILSSKVIKYIHFKIEIGWSPEVISGRIYKDIKQKISFKSIYRYVWSLKQSGDKLYKHLPHRGKKYKYGSGRSTIKDRIDISQRPEIIDLKQRLGDIEGDTVVGVRHGAKDCLLTLVDRASKFTLIRKIPNKTSAAVEAAMSDCYDNSIIPFLTITYDNGTEFSNHVNIANTLGCIVYFARPYRSSDRGLNEHTNGLIRRYFPKKIDFGNVTDEEVQYVQDLLNNRPRKSLGFLTPNEFVNKYLTKSYKFCLSLVDNGPL